MQINVLIDFVEQSCCGISELISVKRHARLGKHALSSTVRFLGTFMACFPHTLSSNEICLLVPALLLQHRIFHCEISLRLLWVLGVRRGNRTFDSHVLETRGWILLWKQRLFSLVWVMLRRYVFVENKMDKWLLCP